MPTYRSKTYRAVSRPFSAFEALHLALSVSNPQTIIPALPLAQSSAATEEEDDRIVKLEFQRWFDRVCNDPAVKHDEELRGFIEGEFGVSRVVCATFCRADVCDSVHPFHHTPPQDTVIVPFPSWISRSR